MEKEVVEASIQKFESKKEFRAVKLQTRQSFREDQAALDRRLSKYRNKSDSGAAEADDTKEHSNGQLNGHVNGGFINNENGTGKDRNGMSKLESIVLDISLEMEDERKTSVSSGDGTDDVNGRRDSLDNSFFFGGLNVNDSTQQENGKPSTGIKTQPNGNGQIHQTTVTSDQILKNGLQNGTNQTSESQRIGNGHLPNGHAVQPSTLIMRPKVNGDKRGSMTPEPKMKLAKGIYQKNPKLTTTSTDHLDNVSVRSFKAGSRTQENQQELAPVIVAAEVTSLPPDGCLLQFSVSQMVTIFRLLHLPGELIYKLSQCNVDGKRFALFSDHELEELGINNPIIRYFRDRSAQRPARRKKPLFVL